MIRLVQDYYDCPIFYMPWTREALTVHLYEPLTEQQMADAELAEAIERREQDLTGLRPEPEATESMYLNIDMGPDLVSGSWRRCPWVWERRATVEERGAVLGRHDGSDWLCGHAVQEQGVLEPRHPADRAFAERSRL